MTGAADLRLEHLPVEGYEQVVRCRDEATGLHALIAVHSTVLGPSLGGTRFHRYDRDEDALVDVLRLAQGMTLKAAVAGLDQGGGKAVILGDPTVDRTDELVLAYGRLVDRLDGAYLTAEDVGTTQADMDLLRTVTPFVTGVSEHLGGSGDPSPATAVGLVHALEALAAHRFGATSLEGLHVAVSGIGKVGFALAADLVARGARITVADVDRARVAMAVEQLGAAAAPVEGIHAVACDVFAPCALGGVLSPTSIAELRCAAVCGSANNQLLAEADGDRLAAAGITYVPDFVANAGGIINIAEERHPEGYDRGRGLAAVAAVGRTTALVLRTAEDEGTTTERAAVALAERRLAAATADPERRPEDRP